MSADFPAMPPARGLRSRFELVVLGGGRVRPGWRVLAFAGIFYGLVGLAKWALPALGHFGTGAVPPGLALLDEAIQLGLIMVATACMARLEGRKFLAYGLSDPRALWRLLCGWAAGLVCLSLVVGTIAMVGGLVFEAPMRSPLAVLGYGLLWCAVFLMVGLSEETLSRGYVLETLASAVGYWPAAALTSLLFAAMHMGNHGETAAGLAQVAVVAVLFCGLRRVSGSLWLGIGFHAAWDWAQSFLYGTPDSGWMMQGRWLTAHAAGATWVTGGSVGPEGSVLATPILCLVTFAIAGWMRRATFRPPSPDAAAWSK